MIQNVLPRGVTVDVGCPVFTVTLTGGPIIFSIVKYEGSSESFRTFSLTLFIKNFKSKLHHFSI